MEGKVNTAKVGTYPLTVTLTDQAENVTSWDLDVRVVSRYPKEDETEEEVYPFADFYEECKQDGRLIGPQRHLIFGQVFQGQSGQGKGCWHAFGRLLLQ